jgi:cell division septal protein FtsQ
MYKKPYKIKRKKNIFKNRLFLLGMLILFLLGAGVYLVCFAPFSQVKTVTVTGCQKVKTADLQDNIKSQVARKIFFLETQSIFLANSQVIMSEILNKFPQIEKVSLTKKMPNGLEILVKEREPAVFLCQNSQCFLVDKNGIAYESATINSGLLPIENKTLVSIIELGQTVIDMNLLSKILEINSVLNNLGIKSNGIEIASEQRMNAKIADGWQAHFNLKGDLSWQATELKTVLENKISPKNWRNLDYIDLRFDRVFVSPEGLVVD